MPTGIHFGSRFTDLDACAWEVAAPASAALRAAGATVVLRPAGPSRKGNAAILDLRAGGSW